jgi:hypothetical protein
MQAITVPGIVSGDRITAVVIFLSEDGAGTFGVASASIDGVAMTEIIDEDGSGFVNAAAYRTSAGTGFIVTDGTINISVTHSEGVTSVRTCLWVFKWPNSATPTSSVQDDDTASGALVLTTGTTVLGGFVIAGCLNTGIADAATWAVLSEQQDTQDAEADYSTADGPATGASMANTCDWTGGNDASGVAVAIK